MTATRSLRARVAAALVLAAAGCAGGRASGIEGRYVAVHNTLAALGMVQVGPIHRGSLVDGAETKLAVDLPAGCTLLVALGGPGVDDLDLALLDADGKPVQRDTTHDAEPSVRVCLERPARRDVAVRMGRGAGEFVAATWSGAAPSSQARATAAPEDPREAAGTCASPVPLAVGAVSGNTRRGEAELTAACASSPSKEIVYRLVLEKRQRVVLDLDAPFDTVLHVREGDCEDAASEVACNDDRPTGNVHSSRIDEVFDAGTYFVVVDGYGTEAGAYRLDVRISDPPALADLCRSVKPLASTASGTFEDGADHTGAGSCAAAKGSDVAYKLDVPSRQRVRLSLTTSASDPVVHLRKTCTDEGSELGCGTKSALGGAAVWSGVLDPASYTVFADAEQRGAATPFTVVVETAPEAGGGVPGDACSDAIPLVGADARVLGDSFAAHDDLSSSHLAGGTPDLVYRLEVPRTSRVRASFGAQEGDHLLALRRSCVDSSSEVAAGSSLDKVLPAGTYFLVVEAKTPTSFGRYRLEVRTRDQSAPDAACRSEATLSPGQVIRGTTAAAGDKFAASCAGPDDKRASADRIYKLVVPKRTRMRITLATPTWDGVLAIRKSCLDAAEAATLRANEVACNNDHHDTHHAQVETVLDPGTYHVLVDGHGVGNEGAFTLEAQVVADRPVVSAPGAASRSDRR